MKYTFYYDESEHSRSIGFKTVTAENFYDNFITVIVGWKSQNEQKIQKQYCEFEQKYLERHPDKELKNETIQPKQLRCGFASTAKGNIAFFDDFLSLFSDNIYIYISTFSKVEYMVNQLFKDYKNSLLFDMDMMRYSIIKALVIYKPRDLVDAIYNNPENIVDAMKAFFKDRIEKNKTNASLKERETESFEQILLVLDDVKPIDCIEWEYTPPFVGFRHFLDEKSISDYSLTIDREGEHQKTVLAARKANLKNVDDEESDNLFGIRMADMLAGMLGKMMKSLCKNLHPTNPDVVQKTILPTEWFNLSDAQLVLYKKLHYIVCELNNAWYKSFAGVYADDLVCINALLNFMSRFTSTEEIKTNLDMQGEYFNAYACQALSKDYKRKQNKLPIEPVPSANLKTDYFFNQRGAKVYIDTQKQPVISIPNGSIRCKVLSVGTDKNMLPLITVEENGKPVCYRLPLQLSEWAFTVVAIANMGQNLFPSEVVFQKKKTIIMLILFSKEIINMFNVIFGEKAFLTQAGDKIIVETVENEDNCTVSECDFKQFLCTYKSNTKYENREIAYFSIECDNRSMILSCEFWKETNLQNLFVRKYESLDERIKKASSESDDELILELDYPRTRIKNVEKSTGL